MAMSAPTQPPPDVPRPVMTGLTWQQFLDLPEEYKHADLVNGELFVNPPVLLHQQIVTRLLSALERWTAVAPDRGEVTFNPAVQISHDRGYMPDIAWWRQDKCAPPRQPPAFDGPPDVVVEVLSPSTRRLDTIRKRNDYPGSGYPKCGSSTPTSRPPSSCGRTATRSRPSTSPRPTSCAARCWTASRSSSVR
jgi:Uma2 family endonuclease